MINRHAASFTPARGTSQVCACRTKWSGSCPCGPPVANLVPAIVSREPGAPFANATPIVAHAASNGNRGGHNLCASDYEFDAVPRSRAGRKRRGRSERSERLNTEETEKRRQTEKIKRNQCSGSSFPCPFFFLCSSPFLRSLCVWPFYRSLRPLPYLLLLRRQPSTATAATITAPVTRRLVGSCAPIWARPAASTPMITAPSNEPTAVP